MNYRIKGTRVPITKDMRQMCVSWEMKRECTFNYEDVEWYSYGHLNKFGINWILVDTKDYSGNNYFMVRESDLTSSKIIGYKSPHDLFKGRVPKDSVFSDYSKDRFVMYCPQHNTSGVPTEIVETWEQVYEEEFKVGDYLIAERAGGWKYSPDNDGCLIEVLGVGCRTVDVLAVQTNVTSLKGRVLNPKSDRLTTFDDVPTIGLDGKPVFRKATTQEIEEGLTRTISVGGKFNVTIKEGRVYHKGDDITVFVNQMFSRIGEIRSFGGYAVEIKDITFSRTGCEHQETKLSDWREVYEAIN